MDNLRIGIVAPPWLPVPPPAYGGTEMVLDGLARGLAARGHEVLLFANGESSCPVPKRSLFRSVDPDRMGMSVVELRHVAAAYDEFATGFDLVHDHSLVGLFYRERPSNLPVVTTCHGPFDGDLGDLYSRAKVPVIAISHDQAARAPDACPIAAVIHHGLDLERYPYSPQGGGHVLFLGRMNQTKGVDAAIEAVRRTGDELVIAAKMREPVEHRYFHEVVEPLLGDRVQYVGEANARAKIDLIRGAKALINPIRWPEPFGLVMIESLACGTPVVGFEAGAAPEIVDHGVTGFLGTEVADLVDGLGRLGELDRSRCRAAVVERFTIDRMAADHEQFYARVLADSTGSSDDLEVDVRRKPVDIDLVTPNLDVDRSPTQRQALHPEIPQIREKPRTDPQLSCG